MKSHTRIVAFLVLTIALTSGAAAQTSQRGNSTQIKGNIEINAKAENMTAVATGENTVAKNRVGVVQEAGKGNTKISASATNVVTTVGGRNKKACTNIGSIVSDECK